MCFSTRSVRFSTFLTTNKLFQKLKNGPFTGVNFTVCEFLFGGIFYIKFYIYYVKVSNCIVKTISSKKLNVSQERSLLSFIQPVGNVLVIALRDYSFFCFVIIDFQVISNFVIEIFVVKFSESSEFGNNICVSKANRVLTQLKPPITVCSKISKCSYFVGNAMITFNISVSIQPLIVLAELHFLGLKP